MVEKNHGDQQACKKKWGRELAAWALNISDRSLELQTTVCSHSATYVPRRPIAALSPLLVLTLSSRIRGKVKAKVDLVVS